MSAEVTDADRATAHELRYAVQLAVYSAERDRAEERIAQALADQRAAAVDTGLRARVEQLILSLEADRAANMYRGAPIADVLSDVTWRIRKVLDQ